MKDQILDGNMYSLIFSKFTTKIVSLNDMICIPFARNLSLRSFKNHVISFNSVISTFFNILHGIEQKDVPLVVALEMAIFLGYEGQLKQDSVMEMELFESTVTQARFYSFLSI